MVTIATPEEVKKDHNFLLIREVMGANYISLVPVRFELTEPLNKKISDLAETKLFLEQICTGEKEVFCVSSTGVGIVDSLFKGLKFHYVEKYKSVQSITLSSFSVATNKKRAKTSEGTDCPVEVVVEFSNYNGKITPFRAQSHSLSVSSALALVSAFEYYINAELSFLKLRALVQDAHDRNRGDIEQNLISKLVKLVGVSKYEELF